MRQTAFVIIIPIMIVGYAFLFKCMTEGPFSTQ